MSLALDQVGADVVDLVGVLFAWLVALIQIPRDGTFVRVLICIEARSHRSHFNMLLFIFLRPFTFFSRDISLFRVHTVLLVGGRIIAPILANYFGLFV